MKSKCLNCLNKTMPSNIQCIVCKLISRPNLKQYLSNCNYFDIFGVKSNYIIDKIKLSNDFKNIQKNIHPDILKDSNSSLYSSIVNIAYKTLLDDISRAKYLLKINKYTEEKNITQDTSKLIGFYKAQEEIENEEDNTKLKQIKNNTLNDIEKIKGSLKGLFENKKYSNIQNILYDIKYKQSIINSIDKKLKLI